MFTSLFQNKFLKKLIIILMTFSFIVIGGIVGAYAHLSTTDNLRKPSLLQSTELAEVASNFNPPKSLKDGGKTALEKIGIQAAITHLIRIRDNQYLSAIGATDTANLVVIDKGQVFAAGHDVLQAMIKNHKAVAAVNILSYNQIEGHLRAAMDQNSVAFLEVARSQLGYALDEKKVVAYVKEVAKNIGCNIPILIHLDHNQYTQELFDQKALLKEEYEAVNGKGTFSDSILSDKSKFEAIDLAILQKVQARLKKNLESERVVVSGITEKCLKAGFTSIAIDASTIFDEFASDLVADFYLNQGTAEESLVMRLEKGFFLPLEWGTNFLKADPSQTADYELIKNKVVDDLKLRNRSGDEIDAKVKEMEQAFAILYREAKKAGLDPQKVIDAYDTVMFDIDNAAIAGKITDRITMTERQKLMIIPGSNAEETAFQLQKIDEIVAGNKQLSWLKGRVGKEIENGHVDKKVPNPRRDGKLEAKMTHPMAVRAMKLYQKARGLFFDVIANNNGSGHGTDYKDDLTPISQVGKITPFLTNELAAEVIDDNAGVAQHGTSGSDRDELSFLAQNGIIKFNIATNYQQLILNVLSLLDDGIAPVDLFKYCSDNAESLIAGLNQGSRDKMKKVAAALKSGEMTDKIEAKDSEFLQFLKVTYAWGKKKGKIKDTSKEVDIALLFAKEFKRAFKDMDVALKDLGQHKVKRTGIVTSGGTASGHNDLIQSAYFACAELGIELVMIKNGWDGFIKEDLIKQSRPLTLKDVRNIGGKGGTILGASRTNPFSKDNIETLPAKILATTKALNLDGVMILGGDDTLGAGEKLMKLDPTIQFVGLSKTMDRDVKLPGGAWTYGFDSYVRNVVKNILGGIADAKTNNKIYVVELFGRNAGFVVNRVAAMVGAIRALVPEEDIDLEQLVNEVSAYKKENKYGTIIVSEGIKINKGTFTKSQVEKAGLDWNSVSKKLTENGWAEQVSPTELLFKADLDATKDMMSKMLGNDFSRNLPILQQANKNYKNNAKWLEAAFVADPAAKLAYEGVKTIDQYGNPKLEKAAEIINAVFKAAKISTSGPEKPGYMSRSGATSMLDRQMTQKQGRAAVRAIAEGRSGMIVYVDKAGKVAETPLVADLGGLKLDLAGEDKDEAILANMARAGSVTLDLGTPAENNILYHGREAAYQVPLTQRLEDLRKMIEEGKPIFDDSIIGRFRRLKTGEQIELSYQELKTLLWKLSTLSLETPENMLVFSDISRLIKSLPEYQQDQLKRLAKIGQFKEAKVSILLEAAFEPTVVFGGAFNALIARAGGFAGAMQDKYQPGVIVGGIKSLDGKKALETRGFVELNEHYVAVFGPLKVEGMYEGEPFEINGVEIGSLIIPADEKINRPEQRVLYFGPKATIPQIGAAFKALGMEVEVVADYGPGKEAAGEKQPARFAEMMDVFGPKVNIISASPVNKDGIIKMLKARGLPESAFKEALYAYNRQIIGPDTKVTDSLSCTTNAMVTWFAALDDLFGIVTGKGHTVHSATDSNEFYPGVAGRARSPLDLLRGFSISDNIQPSGTNAAENLYKVKPGLKGKVKITADRVGTLDGSKFSIDVTLKDAPKNLDELKVILEDFAVNYSGGVVMYWKGEKGKSEAPLEATRIVGNAHSSVLDSFLIEWDPANPNELKIEGWYDNQGAAPAQMIYAWSQWMGESIKFRDALAKINVQSAPAAAVEADGGVALKAWTLDADMYKAFSTGFDNFVNSLKGVIATRIGLIVDARTVIKNAGTATALSKLKNANPEIKIVLWAENQIQVDQLQAMGLAEIASIKLNKLDEILTELNLQGIADERIVLIETADIIHGLSIDEQSILEKKGIKTLRLEVSKTQGPSVNAMPLVVARAVASVMPEQETVVKEYNKLTQSYLDNGQISQADMQALNDLTSSLIDAPLVKVSEEVAKIQTAYEETVGDI